MRGDYLDSCAGLVDVAAVNAVENYSNFVCGSELYLAARHSLMIVLHRSGVGLKDMLNF